MADDAALARHQRVHHTERGAVADHRVAAQRRLALPRQRHVQAVARAGPQRREVAIQAGRVGHVE
ncbi:MAG: hypothetical protein U1F43_27475 [Myxococcota bacterium]